MSLKLSNLEPVNFGGFTAMPRLGQEQRLRVQSLEIEEDSLDNAREVIAQCFGDDGERVKEFLAQNPFRTDYIRLQIYLTQGQSGLDNFERRMDSLMAKEMDKVQARLAEEKAKKDQQGAKSGVNNV